MATFICVSVASRGVDPYGTGGTFPPNIYEGGTSMAMSLQYFRSDVVYDVDSSDHKKLCPVLWEYSAHTVSVIRVIQRVIWT